VVVVIDGGGGSSGGVMEPGGIVRGPVSVGQHVPLLVSLLFCQPLASIVAQMLPSGLARTRIQAAGWATIDSLADKSIFNIRQCGADLPQSA